MFGNQGHPSRNKHVQHRSLPKSRHPKVTQQKITTGAEESTQWPRALQAFDLLAVSQVPRNAPRTDAARGWVHHQNQGMWAAR